MQLAWNDICSRDGGSRSLWRLFGHSVGHILLAMMPLAPSDNPNEKIADLGCFLAALT